MSGGFNDPIVGGGGALVYPAIHSPNYVLAVSGWAIRKDGTAQMTGLVLIGGTFTGGVIRTAAAAPLIQLDGPHNAVLIYDAAANLVETIAPVATNDGLGNAVQPGFTSYSGSVFGQLIAAAVQFGNKTSPFAAAPIVTGGGSGATGAQLALRSGEGSTATVNTSITLQDDQQAGTPGNGLVTITNAPLLVSVVTALVGGLAETFHNLALVNGWTGTARYRLLPDGRVELDLALAAAAATAFQFSTMPAGYRPTASRFIAAGADANVGTAVAPRVQIDSTGVISMLGLHAFSTVSTWVAGGSYPLN